MLNRTEYPYKLAVLKDRNGDFNKRWYITFSVYDLSKNKLQTKYDYDVNKLPKDRATRERFARKRIKEINELLESGHIIKGDDKPQRAPKKVYLQDAFTNILQIKKVEYSHETFNSYRSIVDMFLTWLNNNVAKHFLLTELKRIHVINYLDENAKQGKSAVTLNHYLEVLRAIFNEIMERDEHLNESPFDGIKKKKEVASKRNIAYVGEEKVKLLNLIKTLDYELFQFTQFMYYGFMRPNEIRQLQVRNIQLKEGKIFINALKSKSKRNNFITIPPPFESTLEELCHNKPSSAYLFPGKTAPYVSKNRMGDRHRPFLERLNFSKDHTFYGWKHTGVIDAYKAGVDIKSLQLQLRHSSLQETDIYLKSLGLFTNEAILTKMPAIF